MNTFSFYDPATGLFSPHHFHGHAELLADNTPAGYIAVEGAFDALSQRVDLVATALQGSVAIPPGVDAITSTTLVSGSAMTPHPVVVDYQPTAPADTALLTWSWNAESKRYEESPTLAALQETANADIDAAAGRARLRYITEVPGQQAVYLRKAEESRAFRAAAYSGDTPAYVAAEAQAMGMTPQGAADRILEIADAWDNQLSPAIESLRIGGKNAVALATTVDEAKSARAAALARLDAV